MSAVQAVLPLTLFARREKTTDPVDKALKLTHKNDVVFYKDKECTQFYARYPWHYSGLPRRTSKTVMLNCFRWALQWV